jgi:hypothetical protein
MQRRSLTLVATVSVIALGAAVPANAGCDGCRRAYVQPGPTIVQVFEAPVVDSEIYIVNQGPVLSGPGAFRYQPPYVDNIGPREYPYIGASYYLPYDGGPYADPLRHHVLHPYVIKRPRPAHWQRHGVLHPHIAGPRIITAFDPPRVRRAPRRHHR